MIGDLIDHYRVLELVGRGAMGVVYKALDVNLDRQVAIKVMSVEARNDPDFVERFRLEARLQAALNHPNVAQLFDYFVHDGAPVAVMEFIDGESFEQLIKRRGAIPAHESIPIFKQALLGVAAAHRAGIVHRDLKPSNLMLTRDRVVKVMDFGIAKRQGTPGATKASTSIGSPLYMAPEQILGRPVDCRTDIYALGITLYELLAGQRPFNVRGKAEYLVLDAHVNDVPEPPTVYRLGIPRPIVDAVMRSLAKDPNARFQSADELMSALPDIPAPSAAALPTGTVALPRVGPTGTVALPRATPRATPATPPVAPSSTMTLEYSPPPEAAGTMALEHAATKSLAPQPSMDFDFSAGTVWQQLHPTPSAPPPPPPPPGLMQRLSARRLSLAAVVVTALVLGALFRQPERLHATRQTPAAIQTPTSSEPAAPLSDPNSGPDAPPARSQDAPVARSGAPAPARPELAGTWRGAYVDASGKQLLRVVSLSINRVHDDGGIEGTLQYETASGDGECQLHPRGSSYSAGRQRLQLSPEGCSPHYPKELGVPLDFDGVNPQSDTLKNGRIEAPTGAVVRVRLKRVT